MQYYNYKDESQNNIIAEFENGNLVKISFMFDNYLVKSKSKRMKKCCKGLNQKTYKCDDSNASDLLVYSKENKVFLVVKIDEYYYYLKRDQRIIFYYKAFF